MHFVSKIASMLRLPVGRKPKAALEFFPLPFHKYITLYNEQCVQSNCYDYFNDVILEIKPFLDELGIRIVQFLNAPSEKRLFGCYHIDKFTHYQMNFLIKNSLLHVCTDTYTNEVCGVLDVPSLCLIGNRFAENSFPWYGDRSKHIILSELSNVKPTFASSEEPKSIDSISVEKISQNILDLLGAEGKILSKTLFVGSKYHEPAVCDVIPDLPVADSFAANMDAHIRFDKCHNEQNCIDFCIRFPFSLVVQKRVSEDFLSKTKKNCKKVIFIVSENSDPDEVSFFVKNGIPVEILSILPVSNDLAFKFLDFGKIKSSKNETKDKIHKSLNSKEFRSSKIIYSGGKKYPSYSHLEKGIQISIINNVIDEPNFWNDDCYYRIFKYKRNTSNGRTRND